MIGYTAIIGPKQDQGAFYNQLRADGRLNALIGASAAKPRVLGLGSWDPEVAGKGDYRHTICIDETDETDFSALEQKYPQYPLYRKDIGASDWLCFEDWKWDKDPYALIKQLGYQFHTRNGDFAVGLHFDVMAPERVLAPNPDPSTPAPELWITVTSPKAAAPGGKQKP